MIMILQTFAFVFMQTFASEVALISSARSMRDRCAINARVGGITHPIREATAINFNLGQAQVFSVFEKMQAGAIFRIFSFRFRKLNRRRYIFPTK